jgi:aspartate/methionine/tyrosine aminotransferase
MYSDLVKSIGEAGSIRINQMVYDKRREGIDVVVLSLGEAFFDIPMFDWGAIDFVKGYHYSDTRGIPKLREKIAQYYSSRYSVDCDPNKHILISAGSKIIVYMSILATINPGDEVIIQEPYWVSYPEQVQLCRGVTKVVPYWVKAEDFKNYFTPKTKLVILNNPNNPAGSVYSKEDLQSIHALCKANDAHLMVDEAYSDFCLKREFTSAGTLHKDFENVIVVNSLSKNMGMSGWRVGYMIAHEKLIYDVLRLNQHLITCAPTVLLQYCEQYFDEILETTLPQVREVVAKRNRIAQYMDSIGLKYLKGASTFYFFVDIAGSGKTSWQFAEWLLDEHSIAVVPGSFYGESTDGFVRVGVGTESEERIRNALMTIKSSIQ